MSTVAACTLGPSCPSRMQKTLPLEELACQGSTEHTGMVPPGWPSGQPGDRGLQERGCLKSHTSHPNLVLLHCSSVPGWLRRWPRLSLNGMQDPSSDFLLGKWEKSGEGGGITGRLAAARERSGIPTQGVYWCAPCLSPAGSMGVSCRRVPNDLVKAAI